MQGHRIQATRTVPRCDESSQLCKPSLSGCAHRATAHGAGGRTANSTRRPHTGAITDTQTHKPGRETYRGSYYTT